MLVYYTKPLLIMKISTFLLISCTLIGCGSDDGLLWEETCFIGIVIGPEKCSGATIIQVINRNIGEEIEYYDGHAVKNAIRAPGQFKQGEIHFTVREFNIKKDEPLFDPVQHCPAIYAPFDTPTHLITSHSTTNCPTAK